jgi:hypothetical protein
MNTKKISYKKKYKKSGNKKTRCSEILGECYRCLDDEEFMKNKGLIFKTQNKIPNEYLDAQYDYAFKPTHILERDKTDTISKKKSQKKNSIISKSIISRARKKRSSIPRSSIPRSIKSTKNLHMYYKKMFTKKKTSPKSIEKEHKTILSIIPELKKQNKSDKQIGKEIAESILKSKII